MAASAASYRDVFGWHIRTRGDGATAFDDGVGEVSGAWRADRSPAAAGNMVRIMVEDIESTLATVVVHSGRVVAPVSAQGDERFAQIGDPAGNVIGVYEYRRG